MARPRANRYATATKMSELRLDVFAGYHETVVDVTDEITLFTYIGALSAQDELHIKCEEGEGLGGFAIFHLEG